MDIVMVDVDVLTDGNALLPGTDQAVKHIEALGYTVYLVCNETEQKRLTVETWLAQHGLHTYKLIMPQSWEGRERWKVDIVRQVSAFRPVTYYIGPDCAAIEALGLGIVCRESLQDWMVE